MEVTGWGRTMLCELCQCEEAYNFHHFIPRTLHSNKWFKRRYTRQEMQQGMEVCKPCHSAIHDLIPDEKELGRNYNTRKKLLAHPQLQGFVQWKREKARNKRSKRRIVLQGTLHVKLKDTAFDVVAGQAIIVKAGEWVQYSSPDPAGAEYIAVCVPAFSPQTVHRDGPE